MIFAICQKVEGLDGKFTVGKVYLAHESMQHEKKLVDMTMLIVIDDEGNRVHVNPDHGQFKYPDSVFGVWVGDDKSEVQICKGDIFLIDEADEDALHIEDGGFFTKDNFILIDQTNLVPGDMLMDIEDGKWKKVMRVDEAEWVVVEGSSERRELSDFRFAVGGKDLLSEPVAICIDAKGLDSLTEGNMYVIKESKELHHLVEGDDGKAEWYAKARFSFD